MDEQSTSTAKASQQIAESTEPSPKKQKLSSVPREPPKLPAAVETEFKALRNQWEILNVEALTESQRSVLRKRVPRNMLRSDKFLGSQHVALANLISKEVVEDGVVVNR